MASTQKKNEHWYVRYRDLSGVQRTTSVASEKEADKLKSQVEVWLSEGIDPNRAMATFKQVMEAFFDEHVIPNCKWGTMRDYQSAFERYHLLRWSKTPIRSITKYDVKRARDAMAATDISAKRVNNLMVPVNKMFSWAKEHDYIAENPAETLRPLKTQQEEMLYFTAAQLNTVVEACDVNGGFYRAHLLTLGWTGVRMGELRELRFKDIVWDFSRPRIHVQRAVQDGRESVGLPKSGKRRWVGVPPHIADVLRKQQELLKASDEDLVFPDHNGHRLDPSYLRQQVFHRTLEKLGWREPAPKKSRPKNGEGAREGRGYCPPKQPYTQDNPRAKNYRLHDLRHTYAYIFLNIGKGDLYALKETMGHAQISTTMKYAHFSEDDAVRAADTLSEAWDRVVGNSAQDTASDGSVGQDVG